MDLIISGYEDMAKIYFEDHPEVEGFLNWYEGSTGQEELNPIGSDLLPLIFNIENAKLKAAKI